MLTYMHNHTYSQLSMFNKYTQELRVNDWLLEITGDY